MIDGAVNLRDLETLAEARMDPGHFAYYASGAGDEDTLRDNEAAFARRRLRPRVLRDVAAVDPATSVLGTDVSLPVGIAPTARHQLAHPDGEVATARGAAAAGVLYCASTLSSRTLEDIAEAGAGPRWFQLYTHADRGITVDLVQRAAAAGYRAVVLTADLPVVGSRDREVRAAYVWPEGEAFGNFGRYPATAEAALHRTNDTWADIAAIRAAAPALPLVIKGILTGEDAALAVDHGAAAVWVSNHGGRQLDRVPAGIEVVEEVVAAVDGRAEVYVDGGVRRGTDVLMALALGARLAFVGRPALYALALGGAEGVADAFAIVRRELEIGMALLGTPTVGAITRAHVA